MRVVKRYSNRKLYDTRARKYVTLELIGRLVREGEDVKVLDNVTGEDLTTVTLSQILLEKEKSRRNSLPKSFFTAVLQSGTKLREAIVEKSRKHVGERLGPVIDHLRIPSRSEFDKMAKTVARMERTLKRLEKKLGAKKKK